MIPDLDKMAYRVPTAARLMDIHPATAWRMVAKGKLQTVKDEGTTWILRDELEAYFARLKERQAA